MAQDLQLTHCDACDEKYSSMILDSNDFSNSRIIENTHSEKQLNDDIFSNRQALSDYIDQDIYFYDLYITYNNFHQDIPTRQAI